VKLHLGSGRTRREGWVNVDCVQVEGVTDLVCDLDGLDLAKMLDPDTVTRSEGVHLLEHLAHPLEFMTALWEVTEPGGTAKFETPYGSSDDAWEDPTHRRPYFLQSFEYFGQPNYWRASYQYDADWRVLEVVAYVEAARWAGREDQLMPAVMRERNVVDRMVATLQAVKPARPADKDLRVPTPVRFEPA
jgi:hypothetical protein